METIANAALRRGGSELRDAFLEALLESKTMSINGLRHAASVSNFEGSLDSVASIENIMLGQELVTEQSYVQSRALILNKETMKMRELLEEAKENLNSRRYLYDFFMASHCEWVKSTAEEMSVAGMRRLWQADLKLGWMKSRMRGQGKLLALLNKESKSLQAAAANPETLAPRKGIRVGPLGGVPRKLVAGAPVGPPGSVSARVRPPAAMIKPPGRLVASQSGQGWQKQFPPGEQNATGNPAQIASGRKTPPPRAVNAIGEEMSADSEEEDEEYDSEDFSDSFSTLSEIISELEEFNYEAESRLNSRQSSVVSSRHVSPPISARSTSTPRSNQNSTENIEVVTVEEENETTSSVEISEEEKEQQEAEEQLKIQEELKQQELRQARLQAEKQAKIKEEKLASIAAENLIMLQEEREQQDEIERRLQLVEESEDKKRAAAANLWGQAKKGTDEATMTLGPEGGVKSSGEARPPMPGTQPQVPKLKAVPLVGGENGPRTRRLSVEEGPPPPGMQQRRPPAPGIRPLMPGVAASTPRGVAAAAPRPAVPLGGDAARLARAAAAAAPAIGVVSATPRTVPQELPPGIRTPRAAQDAAFATLTAAAVSRPGPKNGPPWAGRASAAIAARAKAPPMQHVATKIAEPPEPPKGTPIIVVACLTQLYRRGLLLPSLFETKVPPREVLRAKAVCDASQGSEMAREDPHVISNLLLLYFREMPEPLLEFKLYDKWVQALEEKQKTPALRKLMQQLPSKQTALLSYLLQFLHSLLKYSAQNGATVEKLAKAFGIFLLRPQGFKPEGGKKAGLVVESLLRHCDELLT